MQLIDAKYLGIAVTKYAARSVARNASKTAGKVVDKIKEVSPHLIQNFKEVQQQIKDIAAEEKAKKIFEEYAYDKANKDDRPLDIVNKVYSTVHESRKSFSKRFKDGTTLDVDYGTRAHDQKEKNKRDLKGKGKKVLSFAKTAYSGFRYVYHKIANFNPYLEPQQSVPTPLR